MRIFIIFTLHKVLWGDQDEEDGRGEIRNTCNILFGNLEGTHSVDLDVVGKIRIIL
jgi:hypothetical protein